MFKLLRQLFDGLAGAGLLYGCGWVDRGIRQAFAPLVLRGGGSEIVS